MDETTSAAGFCPASESPSLRRWQAAGKWLRYGSHAVFGQLGGSGEAVVLIHGFPTASWDWHRIWPFLTAQYRAYALDMLGFGFSDKPSDYPYSLTDQADLYQGWLENMGLTRVHILAHDYGCSVAQELLARSQENSLRFSIASVCFLNGAVFPEVHKPILVQKLLAGPAGPLMSRVFSRRVFDYNLRRIFGPETQPGQADLDDFWQLMVYNNGRGVVHKLMGYMDERQCHRHRWVGSLLNARQPVRVIVGSADPISGRGVARRFRELALDPDVVLLRGVGHYPHYERPGLVWSHYRSFLERVQAEDS